MSTLQNYLHVCEPDCTATIDIAATIENVEATITITRDGEDLLIEVKAGANARIVLDELIDIGQPAGVIDFGPDSKADFSSYLGDAKPEAKQRDYQHHYEHGQWWVISLVSGETWSVVQAMDDENAGEVYADFELIEEGADE